MIGQVTITYSVAGQRHSSPFRQYPLIGRRFIPSVSFPQVRARNFTALILRQLANLHVPLGFPAD